MKLSLPETFEAYSDARKAGFLKVKTAKEGGRRVAGTFCTFTPLEILDAAGMLAVSLCGMSAETIPAAEVDLPRNLCPLIKSSYGFYVSDKCPYTYFSDLIVGETTCDGKKKMYELMARGKELFLLHLPQGVDLPYARDMWRAEVRRLKEYLEERFGAEITDDALRAAARQRNALREARSHLMEVLRADPAPVSGTELYKVLDGLGFDFDLPSRRCACGGAWPRVCARRSPPLRPGGPRLLVTGCPIGGVYQKVLGAAERAGAQVVCFENCAGIKPARCCVDAGAEGYSDRHCRRLSHHRLRRDDAEPPPVRYDPRAHRGISRRRRARYRPFELPHLSHRRPFSPRALPQFGRAVYGAGDRLLPARRRADRHAHRRVRGIAVNTEKGSLHVKKT